MASVATSLDSVRHRIRGALLRSGRPPDAVTLVAVSKTVSEERIREMIAAGHEIFGENRVQEALRKIPAVGAPARWHLVGHLQRNKARHAVGVFELLHGVDGEDLLREIDRRAERAGVRQAVLVQVNLSQEATKHGLGEDGVDAVLAAAAGLGHVDVRGLMTIPPPVDDPEDSRPWFARLRALRDRLAADTGMALPELSMGMTDDFEVAVEEGATLVRVGRALFGERPPVDAPARS